ncbi:MAG: hypothetical protein M5U09_26645, partial [Gammaproteobacteria bacterium]|nr:hypothetical protein [Gammaproteobacteria bacterium]
LPRPEVVKGDHRRGGETVLTNEAVGAEQPVALSLFQPMQGRRADFTVPTARPLVITAEITIQQQPDPKVWRR